MQIRAGARQKQELVQLLAITSTQTHVRVIVWIVYNICLILYRSSSAAGRPRLVVTIQKEASMKVGASLSCSGSARAERVPTVINGKHSHGRSTQMMLSGPAAPIHYTSRVRLGRAGQRFAKSSQRAMYSSRNGRRGGLIAVSFIPKFVRV